MSLCFKIDILSALKDRGYYNTTRLRREKLLAEGVIQALRDKKPISGPTFRVFVNYSTVSRGIY